MAEGPLPLGVAEPSRSVEWVSFAEALGRTQDRPRHLLLGNGFSMSVHQGFGYSRLFDEAVRFDPGLRHLFENFGCDFERALAGASTQDDQARIRDAFIWALAHVHPKIKYLAPSARENCGTFLEAFAGRDARKRHPGHVFTTNYDLMLYWVVMANKSRLSLYDGFNTDAVWDAARVEQSALFYLHGALHHYEKPFGHVRPKLEQRKLLWREGASLIEQVRANLDRGFFPVFVSEGSGEEKARHIRRNPYLRKVGEHFEDVCARADAALFTVGHSLASVDDHITQRIGDGAAEVFLGVYKPMDDGTRARALANTWSDQRRAVGKPPLRVSLFDSSECCIWT